VNALAKPMVDGSALTTDDWTTPQWLCDALGWFDLDPCSNERSHVSALETCSLNHPNEARRDGLAFDWKALSVFVNCPYSNVGPWALKLATHDGPWCALLKLDPTTKWWVTLMSANPTVAPFRKRLKFEGDKAMTANFPSVLVFKRWAPSDELAKHLWLPRWS
jgi:hypothetical protein